MGRAGYKPLNRNPRGAPSSAASIDTSGQQVRLQFRGSTVGAEVHKLIEAMLADGYRNPSAEEIFAAAARHPWCARQRGPQSRQMARRRVAVPAGVYFLRHPPAQAWTLIGTEVQADGVIFDVAWEIADGRVIVDELKSEVVTLAGRLALADQVARQVAAGRALWGAAFVGVRVCILMDPRLSFTARAIEGPGGWTREQAHPA